MTRPEARSSNLGQMGEPLEAILAENYRLKTLNAREREELAAKLRQSQAIVAAYARADRLVSGPPRTFDIALVVLAIVTLLLLFSGGIL